MPQPSDPLAHLTAYANAPVEERCRMIREAYAARGQPVGPFDRPLDLSWVPDTLSVAGPHGTGDMGHRYFGFDRTG